MVSGHPAHKGGQNWRASDFGAACATTLRRYIGCMQEIPIIHISKFDAAKRQLETAIRLWFHSGDPVSVHTLAAASHQLLHDLGNLCSTSGSKRASSRLCANAAGITGLGPGLPQWTTASPASAHAWKTALTEVVGVG
jgi:hypothetical protein